MATKVRKNRDELYATWQEAAEAVQRMDPLPRNVKEFIDIVDGDGPLPTHPDKCYEDFPGWETFLGRDKK